MALRRYEVDLIDGAGRRLAVPGEQQIRLLDLDGDPHLADSTLRLALAQLCRMREDLGNRVPTDAGLRLEGSDGNRRDWRPA